MSPFVTKRAFALVAVCFSATALTLLAADPRSVQPTKAEIERKSAEAKRKIEQRQREIKAASERQSQQVRAELTKARSGASGQSAAHPFDAASAPPPDECFRAFVAAAKNASSMEELLPFLPDSKQEALKARQSRFDPKQ